LICEVFDVFGSLSGNAHPCLGHDLNRMRVQPMGLDPRRVSIDEISLEVTRPPLGYLAPARVPGAKEKEFETIIHSQTRNKAY
jgi:hypothetical protein